MRQAALVVMIALAVVLVAQPPSSRAGSAPGSATDVRIRELEEKLRDVQRELAILKEEQKATKSEVESQVDVMPRVRRWMSNLEWLSDLRFTGSVTIRYDYTTVEDREDVLLENDELESWRTRDRLGVTYEPDGPVNVGLRLSTGGTPNPTSPFVNLGDGLRSKNIYLDRYYFVLRPLKLLDDPRWREQPYEVVLHVGKMPQPFWLGGRGTWASETVWDQDVNPEGFALKLAAPKLTPYLGLEATGAYFAIEQIEGRRFAGLTADTYMAAGQLLATIQPEPLKGLKVAFTVYDDQNLNAGARSPVFDPVNTVTVPGQTAFLLRPGFQATNNHRDLGVGAVGFEESSFLIINPAAQVYFDLPTVEVSSVAAVTPEVFLYGEYLHNTRVSRDSNGYAGTVGLNAGEFGSGINPFALWFTYRDVDNDATLATFADSDLGAGTGYKGFEMAGYYRLHKNLQLQVSYFDFNGSPFKVNGVQRIFFDMITSF